ncbi:MAG: hypothetical protein JWO89_463 [Verrucomicrobiaceae bacterium]|nr:hypothetical protein [Verrucomicrobiaceae bacterium]
MNSSFDLDKIDEAVLALLHLTSFQDKDLAKLGITQAWKGHDWDALQRLHEKGFISDPVGKAKSVTFTPEGVERAKELFEKLFAR